MTILWITTAESSRIQNKEKSMWRVKIMFILKEDSVSGGARVMLF